MTKLPSTTTPVALTIAGSDPSGGAGLQADLKTFHQHQVYGMSVVTLLTVQNTQTVDIVQPLDLNLVQAQMDAVCKDITPTAAKTGALATGELIQWLAAKARSFPFPLVVDPVMISKHGFPLVDDAAQVALRDYLLPHAYLVTPNRFEAAALVGREVRTNVDFLDAARRIVDLGAANVLIKGLRGDGTSDDLLWSNGETHWLSGPLVETPRTHGSGCVYSAAITAQLAKGTTLIKAVEAAKRFISRAIATAPGLGQGRGPVNMLARVD